MRLAAGILLIAASPAFSQANDAALRLLRDVNATAKSLKSWRVEGVETGRITRPGTDVGSEFHFAIASESPLKMRQEHTGDDHTLAVCDGAEMFYWGGGPGFFRNPATAARGCNFSLADFYALEENPVSASMTGRERVQLDGVERECEVVREEWNSALPGTPAWRYVRTLCVDTDRGLILRDRTEATDSATNSSSLTARNFTLVESNPELPADLFRFTVPTGSIQDDGPQISSKASIPVNGVYPVGLGVPYPRLASKVEPVYTREARVLKISGLALVALDIDIDGRPQHVKLIRGAGHGLDEKAIEAVSQWSFEPVLKDGAPVAVGPIVVAVNFVSP